MSTDPRQLKVVKGELSAKLNKHEVSLIGKNYR